MMCRTLISAALLVAVTALTDRATADETHVISSDATARFMAIGIRKAIVIDLATDIRKVLVADQVSCMPKWKQSDGST